MTLMKSKTDTAPLPIVNVGTSIDFHLAELLGERALMALVMYFDGQPAPWVGGTPPDTPASREQRMEVVNAFNRHGREWEQFFPEWARMFREKMGLPEHLTAKTYRPLVELKVHRVVAGYSQHLSAAMSLFEQLKSKLKGWSVSVSSQGAQCNLVAVSGGMYTEVGESVPAVIALAFERLLEDEKQEPGAGRSARAPLETQGS